MEDEIGFLNAGGVHVLDTRACDGTAPCTPVRVGGWDLPGRDMQTAAIHRLFRHPNFNGSFLPFQNRSFIYDAHNLDRKGENLLLVANYGMGIRLIDTSDKTAPREIAFHMTNANQGDACKMDCGHTGRQTWGSYFGSDGLIYASDLSFGFFIVDPSGRSAPGSRGSVAMAGRAMGEGGERAGAGRAAGATGPTKLHVARRGDSYILSFSAPSASPARGLVYDVAGRVVAKLRETTARGGHGDVRAISWDGRGSNGERLPRGIYFARAEAGPWVATGKLLHLFD
jgi:hypothetical protein